MKDGFEINVTVSIKSKSHAEAQFMAVMCQSVKQVNSIYNESETDTFSVCFHSHAHSHSKILFALIRILKFLSIPLSFLELKVGTDESCNGPSAVAHNTCPRRHTHTTLDSFIKHNVHPYLYTQFSGKIVKTYQSRNLIRN